MAIEHLLYLLVHLFNKYSYMDVTELDFGDAIIGKQVFENTNFPQFIELIPYSWTIKLFNFAITKSYDEYLVNICLCPYMHNSLE